MGQFTRWFGQTRGALLLLWALWLVPRLLLACLHVTPTSDADWYFHRAGDLAAGLGYLDQHGHATAYWPPGWPLTMALLFRAMGVSVAAVAGFNLICAAVSAWLMQDLATRIGRNPLAGRVALLLIALYPNHAAYVPLAMTETFYTALLLGGCWLLVVRTGWFGLALAGVVFGLAMLVKAQTLVVVPLIFAIRLWRQGDVWRRLPGLVAQGALVVALALLTVSPWTLRNHRELGAWVMVSTNGGITLLTGNNDSARGGFTPDDPVVHALNARSELNELQFDAEAKRLGVAWIAAHPGRFLTLMPRKLLQLWGPDGDAQWAYELGWPGWARWGKVGLGLRVINQGVYGVMVLGMAAFAFVRLRQRERRIDWWLLPYGIAAYVSAIAVVFSGQPRFHFPVMPFAAMACGWLAADWLARRRA